MCKDLNLYSSESDFNAPQNGIVTAYTVTYIVKLSLHAVLSNMVLRPTEAFFECSPNFLEGTGRK